MELLKQNMKDTNGFSLIEVVVALLIFSLSVITIYQLITSTSISIFNLEDRFLAKEVANNRISLINTIEKPINKQQRNGVMNMGGKNWYWKEEFTSSYSAEVFEFEIIISDSQSKPIYKVNGYINE
jgi:general secretion pathway protein I